MSREYGTLNASTSYISSLYIYSGMMYVQAYVSFQRPFLGGMGAASNATSKFYCQLQSVVAFHISMGIFLTCVGLLLCTIMVWRAVGDALTKIHKSLHHTFLFALAVCFIVLIPVLFFSLFAILGLFILAAIEVFPIAKADYCNHVLYYWAFVYVVILLAVVGVAIIVGIVYALVFLFRCRH